MRQVSPSSARPTVQPHAELRALLTTTRANTLRLLEGLPEAALTRAHSPLMSPLVWDLAHIANVEEQYLVRALGDARLVPETCDELYDPVKNPRATREQLPLLSVEQAREYTERVRACAFRILDSIDFTRADLPEFLRDGFLHRLVAQHEAQHAETMIATLALMTSHPYRPDWASRGPQTSGPVPVPADEGPESFHTFSGGEFACGAEWDGTALDNERPRHLRRVEPFALQTVAVTNGRYLAFILEGGYSRREWWSDEGWAAKEEGGWSMPLFWSRDGNGFLRRRFGWTEPVPAHEPVCHVSFHEAEAFARSQGARLPTEFEWEFAASSARGLRHPWGDEAATNAHAALFECTSSGPGTVTQFSRGRTPSGLHGLLGGVWEWTSSTFEGHPGFRADLYRDYSEPFFGPRFRVLRGGSWATQPIAVRNTFRNWDFPIRRQIFSGFRLARDA